MKQLLLQERYPVFTLEVEKQETLFTSVDEILDHLKQQIDDNEIATFIAIFDHYSHTRSLTHGQIDSAILDAKNIVFCFGITLPNPQAMAVRPRSIGVVETHDEFIITFMEAPMPLANVAMESWARSIRNRQAA
ncbi:MAG: hypothetical protein KDI68_09230 [Gammaproteobacteria bacterium]|nr:hypothetical protein [Gammaproteobacteria bacterium]